MGRAQARHERIKKRLDDHARFNRTHKRAFSLFDQARAFFRTREYRGRTYIKLR